MLKEIGIKNFALIDQLRLTLASGLNALTGETGAGKSIVLDAIGLLLGDRFNSESIRQGADRSEIDSLFDMPRSREFRAWWSAHEFNKAEEILIRREGQADGRSRAFINDRPVTLSTLQELGAFLVDVHGQHEHQTILNPGVQLASLDRFADLEDECTAIAPLYRAWHTLVEETQAESLSEQERMQRIDVYQFQLQEIEKAQLREGEDEELTVRLPELKNAEKLRSLAEGAYSALYQEEGSVLERLGQVEKIFGTLQGLAPAVEPLRKEVEESRARLEEAAHQLQQISERWEADPAALENALNRQEQISRLQKKYGGSMKAILDYADKLRADLDRLQNAESYKKDLEKRCVEAGQLLEKASQQLSAKRKVASRQLAQAVQKELKDLGLAQAVFRVTVESVEAEKGNPIRFSSTGIDRVTFEWAPNPGEGIQPLKAIVSGGEMSRVMLALKTVLAQADHVPTLVFDEVDAGIGGLTGQAVGQKLRALSRHHQILCVTHLPQIASCAHAHFHVSKEVVKSRTFARIIPLTSNDRLQELARLLGSQVTPTSMQHARELLAQNQ